LRALAKYEVICSFCMRFTSLAAAYESLHLKLIQVGSREARVSERGLATIRLDASNIDRMLVSSLNA